MKRFAKGKRDASSRRSDRPLTMAEIKEVAPSEFATAPHSSRSERYGFVPTSKVVEALLDVGYGVFDVRQSVTRNQDKRPFTQHMLRLRPQELIKSQGDTPELIMINSHDGSSAYNLMAGFFRFVCSNGLVAGDFSGMQRVGHTGNVIERVIEGADIIRAQLEEVAKRVFEYKGLKLSPNEIRAFAQAALMVRYPVDDQGNVIAPITSDALLDVRREEDEQTDLWTVFNRIQENLLVGGLPGRASTGRGIRTRGITALRKNVVINQKLWTLADSIVEKKKR